MPGNDEPAVGINVGDGSLLVRSADVAFDDDDPDDNLGRVYNSASAPGTSFGPHWKMTTGADVRLAVDSGEVRYTDPSGYTARFVTFASGAWTAAPDTPTDAVLAATATGWTVTDAEATFVFAQTGRLLEQIDDAGQHFAHEYTSAGGHDVWSALRYPDGRHVRASYDGFGRIIELDDPASRHYRYGYIGTMLSSVTTPAGTTGYSYDAAGRLAGIALPGGGTWSFGYDAAGRVTSFALDSPGSPEDAIDATLTYAQPGPDCAPDLRETTIDFGSDRREHYCVDAGGLVVDDTRYDYDENGADGANGRVHVDLLDGDGTTAPAGNIPVGLRSASGVRFAAQTGETGDAWFHDLAPGVYSVAPVQISGAVISGDTTITIPAAGQGAATIALTPQDDPSEEGRVAASSGSNNPVGDFIHCSDEFAVGQCARFAGDAYRAIYVAKVLFAYEGRDGTVPDGTQANAFQHSYAVARYTRTMITVYPDRALDDGLRFAQDHEQDALTDSSVTIRRNANMDFNNNRVGYNYTRDHQTLNVRKLCDRMREKAFHIRKMGFTSSTDDNVETPPASLRTRLLYIRRGNPPTPAQFFPRYQACVYALQRYDDVSFIP